MDNSSDTLSLGLRGYRKRWRDKRSNGSGREGSLDVPCEAHDSGLDGFTMVEFPDVDDCGFSGGEFEGVPSISYELESPVESAIGATGSQSGSAYDPQVEDPHRLETGWKQHAMTTTCKRAKMERPKLPWEQSHMSFIFRNQDPWAGTAVANLKDAFVPSSIGCNDVLSSTVVAEKVVGQMPSRKPPVSKLKLQCVRKESADEDIRRMALAKIQDIVLQDPLATQLGASLHGMVMQGHDHDFVAQSFHDCFRMKASSTLQKRAGSLVRLVKILRGQGVFEPLRMTESQLYIALCHMRNMGAGATSAQRVIEAIFFLDSTAKLILVDIHAIVSGRCRGVARDMFLTKDPLAQKYPFSVVQVQELETQMSLVPDAMKCILGQILFCIHACCRWKDAQRLKSVTTESASGETLVHGDALSSKTTLSAEARTRFLPYVALGTGVTGEDWARSWLEARCAENLCCGDFSLPSYSERNADWTSSPMSASEATYWLREFLTSLADRTEASKYGSHSCKTTLLTWMSRSTVIQFTPAERRLAGHHIDPGMKSVLCYSREAYTSLYAKILSMIKLIRTNVFNPDLPAIERIVQMSEGQHGEQTGDAKDQGPCDYGEIDSESSVASEPDMADVGHGPAAAEDVDGPELISLMHDFPGVPERSLLVHSISGVVHVVNEDDVFLCGRKPSVNFQPYEHGGASYEHFEGCRQCKKVYKAKGAHEFIQEVGQFLK